MSASTLLSCCDVRAFRLRCQPHRKRESRHRASGCGKLPPPTPERCERRLFPQEKRGLPKPHPSRPRRSPPPLNKKSEQYRCQPVCPGNTGVCRLGCVEFIYISVSARYAVCGPECQRDLDARLKLDRTKGTPKVKA